MKKILFLSAHLFFSKRKVSFHHLAKAALKKNYEVTFITVPNSLFSFIGDFKNTYNRIISIYYGIRTFTKNKLRVSSYISIFHDTPKLRLSNLLNLFFLFGYSKAFEFKYDIIMFDSTVSLYLYDRLKRKNKNARFIYRVSDDLVMLKQTVKLQRKEREIINNFNLVSTPSDNLTTKLLRRHNISTNLQTHYHGINTKVFSEDHYNPYDTSMVNFIFVGVGFLDNLFISFVKSLQEQKENYIFHFIGPISNTFSSKNSIFYGELKFEETIPFIKFADIGIQIRNFTEGIDVLEKSLKIIQYSYCKLPIISPKYLKLKGTNNFYYDQSYKSIKLAINKALNFNRSNYDNSWVNDWDTVFENILIDN